MTSLLCSVSVGEIHILVALVFGEERRKKGTEEKTLRESVIILPCATSWDSRVLQFFTCNIKLVFKLNENANKSLILFLNT